MFHRQILIPLLQNVINPLPNIILIYLIYNRSKTKKDEEEESADGGKSKKVPLSLEELVAKRKAEQDALSKVYHLTLHSVVETRYYRLTSYSVVEARYYHLTPLSLLQKQARYYHLTSYSVVEARYCHLMSHTLW